MGQLMGKVFFAIFRIFREKWAAFFRFSRKIENAKNVQHYCKVSACQLRRILNVFQKKIPYFLRVN